jgi:hypothetical protein
LKPIWIFSNFRYISGGFTNNLNVAFDSATQKTVGVVLSEGLADKKMPDSL